MYRHRFIYLDAACLSLTVHRVADLHIELVHTARKVGIRKWAKITAAYRQRPSIKACKTIAHLRLRQRVVVHVCVYGYFPRCRWQFEITVFIRIVKFTISSYKRNSLLEIFYIFERFLYIDLGHARAACYIQIAFICQFTVRIARRYARQTVGGAIKHRLNVLVCDQFVSRHHIYAVTAEHPNVTLAVFIKVKVVGIWEFSYRGHLVILGHVRDRIAGHEPEHLVILVELDPHHYT